MAQNPQPWLNWISSRATILLPITLTEAVSADPDDEKFLECALAAKADYIVTRDRDLLELEKPFGIRVVDDRGFLRGLGRLRAR